MRTRSRATAGRATRIRPVVIALATIAVFGVTACSGGPDGAAKTPAVPHGTVKGATESTEPQPHLATVDGSGKLALLDLLDEHTTNLGTLDDVSDVSTDGRFAFASSASTGELAIIDTGAWTVDHEDHSHYYRATPSVVGTIEGAGEATVASDGSVTAVWFGESGRGILLDRDALATGKIVKSGRIDVEPHTGVLVPFGEYVLASDPGDPNGAGDGGADAVIARDSDGAAVPGARAECVDPKGTITTRVGVAIGCADGAVLATIGEDDAIHFEAIPYPSVVAESERATSWRGRPGRPTVAAVAGDTGAWLLDTRERTWTHLPTERLLRVAAVDDTDEHVVALAADGRVLVLDPRTGATLAATESLLAASVADPSLLAGLELTVDANRAYLNAPAEGIVYEIDFADGARVSRTFPTAHPSFLAETGR